MSASTYLVIGAVSAANVTAFISVAVSLMVEARRRPARGAHGETGETGPVGL